MSDTWSHLDDAKLRELIATQRKAAEAMEAELIGRHTPVAVMLPRSVVQRIHRVFSPKGLVTGDLSYADREAIARAVSKALL